MSPPAAVFRFDEVVAERPAGVTSLDQLFLVSPREGVPSVDWKREAVTVRPRKGWRANTTYVVTLLPGMADLRGNIRNTGARTFFSTGPSVATGRISGKVWDWMSGIPAQRGYVEAVLLPDSVSFLAFTDSTGAFAVEHLPVGKFLVRGVVDENRNRGLDPREAWDTVTVIVRDTISVALLVVARDSVAPTIRQVTADDSITVRLTFDRALDPLRLPGAADVVVRAPDSSALRVVSVSLPAVDSAFRTSKSPRPPPPDVLVVRLGAPLRRGAEYRVSIAKVTGLTGVSAPAVRTFTVPSLPLIPAVKPAVLPPEAAPVKR